MAIVHMASQRTDIPADAVNVRAHCHVINRDVSADVIGPCIYFTYETQVGKCLFESERNGYDDSDFFMTYWDEATQAPKRVCFATTRGWTYPCLASRADATDEVKAKYQAYLAVQRLAAEERAAKRKAATPDKGKQVKVVKSNKNAKEGEVGQVFWFGKDKFVHTSRYMTDMQRSISADLHRIYGDPRDNMRVGVEIAGRKVFIPAKNVEVI